MPERTPEELEKEKQRILAEYRKELKKQKDAEDLKPVAPKDDDSVLEKIRKRKQKLEDI